MSSTDGKPTPMPDHNRACWLLDPVSSIGRLTISAQQYEELRAVALSLDQALNTIIEMKPNHDPLAQRMVEVAIETRVYDLKAIRQSEVRRKQFEAWIKALPEDLFKELSSSPDPNRALASRYYWKDPSLVTEVELRDMDRAAFDRLHGV